MIVNYYKPQAGKNLSTILCPIGFPGQPLHQLLGDSSVYQCSAPGQGVQEPGLWCQGCKDPLVRKLPCGWMAVMPSSQDGYCLPPLLGKEKSLSGNINIKGLDRKAYSQAVLLLLDKASCLERLWVGLFKGTVDPQPTLHLRVSSTEKE